MTCWPWGFGASCPVRYLQHILWFSSSTLMETDLDVLTTEETDDLGVIW